jgi:hypothetical protein
VTDKNARLIGLLILLVSLGMLYIAFLEPISQARAGKASVSDGSKVVALLPLSTIMAIGFMARGKLFFEAIASDNGTKFTAPGLFIFVVGALLGFAMMFWYGDILGSLGYVMRTM